MAFNPLTWLNLWTVKVFIHVLLILAISNKDASSEKSLKKEEATPIRTNYEETVSSPLCLRKCPNSVNGTNTWKFCESNDEFKMQGRCCMNTTQDAKSSSSIPVLGIDLHSCNLTEKEFADGFQNFSNLVVISLEGNPIDNITSADFHENIGIKYLSLPPNVSCPGGEDAWGSIDSNVIARICKDEQNFCRYKNITCPENSHCEPAGIELSLCLCNVGYHGYKCLNQGTFPIIPYAIGLAVPTVVLGLLLWCSQRRYVKSKTT